MKLLASIMRMAATVGAGFLLVAAWMGPVAKCQIATTTVQGTVYRADGSAASGSLLVSWPAFSTASGQEVAAGRLSAVIGKDGSVSLKLAPNSGAYPAGTYYTAVYHLDDGTVSREYWIVPATETAAITAVKAQLAPATMAIQSVSKSYVDNSIAAVTGDYVPLAGGTMSGPLQLSGDPLSGSQAATKHYADVLAASELPLAGGSLSGTLNTPNHRSKLPRVNVTHPDFGAGCANAADPTGVKDSTCAIEAAIAWATENPQGSTWPALYFPSGTYKISAALELPCQLNVSGDGEAATVIEPTNNSANAFTIKPIGSSPQPNMWDCEGSLENMSIHALGGHLYTATLIEIDAVSGYTLNHIRGSNGGGRGLSLTNGTERITAIDTEWDTIRWPVVATGNELKFYDTLIASGGEDSNGYCFGRNCVNGVYPAMQWAVAQQLVSASGDGTTATYVVKGGSDSGSTNGVSPLVAGHWFTVAGLTGATGLNGLYKITSVTNNSPQSDEYTVTAANSTVGTATVTSATYKPTILPDRHASFFMTGSAVSVIGGSIKSQWYQGCFETGGVYGGLIEGFYCEGYPVNGQPHLDADIAVNGEPPYTTTTGVITSDSVAVADTSWFAGYVNDPGDVQGGLGIYKILPQDFVKNSTDPSAYVPGVQKGQYELVYGTFAGDSQLHIQTRNRDGSTAPANTEWPAGSIVATLPGGNYGTLEVANNHFNAVDGPGSNWAAGCDDASDLICSEVIVGSIPNGYTTFSASGQAGGGTNVSAAFRDDEWWTGSTQDVGAGFIKVSIMGDVAILGRGAQSYGSGETSEAVNGQYSKSNVIAVQEADGSYASTNYVNPSNGQRAISGTYYDSGVANWNDQVLGNNPGSGTNGYAMGHQFANSSCEYDVPPVGQSHALTRDCIVGGPSNTGSSAKWEYDSWNGSAWITQFSIDSTGKLSGGAFADYPTLDGDNYFTGHSYFGPTNSSHLLISNQGSVVNSINAATIGWSGNTGGSWYALSFSTSGGYSWGCQNTTGNPHDCTATISEPSPGVLSVDGTGYQDGQGTLKAKGYVANGSAGFTGTATAGSCVLTITGGLITGTSGC